MKDLNKMLVDRQHVFYWQTDRAVEPEEAGRIWSDRHSYFTDDEILDITNKALSEAKLSKRIVELYPHDESAQTNLGNVNSVRIGKLASGGEVIIRCHPRGIANGYFDVETVAASRALACGVPSYRTFVIHDAQDANDFAFQVIEKLPGMAVVRWLETHPEDEAKILFEIGQTLARIHQVRVTGFGPFDNNKAKTGELVGLHSTYVAALRAGLKFNLDILVKEDIFTRQKADKITALFGDDNELLTCDKPVLIHNDFADWNVLTDGDKLTGVLDWDECVGGDAVSDIACWSTFFDPGRLEGMLKGYWSVAEKPDDFNDKFELLRLRYTVSKMTLRLRRYSWDPSDFMRDKIEDGRQHLAISIKVLGL